MRRVRGELQSAVWTYDASFPVPARFRRSCRYDAFIPTPVADYDEPLSADLVGTLAEAESAVRRLNDRARPALAPLARLLLRTESIASSKVEGLQVDARQLARAETQAKTGRTPGPEAAEILANIDAMAIAIDSVSSAKLLTADAFREIHAALMRNAPNRHIAGRVRTAQNWIGGNDYNPCGAAYVPPPPDLVDGLLGDLVALCNEDHLSPLMHAALAHAQFETIHPFDDGNGRTGRALTQVILRRRGLAPDYVPPISVVLAMNRDRYIDGLTRFREGDVATWFERFAIAVSHAAGLAERYLARVADLQETWRDKVRRSLSLRADAAAWAVIDALPAHPVVTVPVAVAATVRSKSAVTIAFDQLVDAGVLVAVNESQRNRAWEAFGLLDLLSELEQGE